MDRKKKILFVMPSMCAGGAEKSLVSLLNTIDYSKYEVDLKLFAPEGLFLGLVPDQVNILDTPLVEKTFNGNIFKALTSFVRTRRFKLLWDRIIYSVILKLPFSIYQTEQYSWKYRRESYVGLEKMYDSAIGFLEKSSIYYVIDRVKSKKKTGFIHIDYTSLKPDTKFDKTYFSKLDTIATVSDECKDILTNCYPELSDNIAYIKNIVSSKLIHTQAEQMVDDIDEGFTILSIGRLCTQKNFKDAVSAMKLLKDRGYNLKWYIIGQGALKDELEEQIKELGIEDNFILLGLRSNPYPYIKRADIIAQTSLMEGKSIVLDEAKILNKPILATNYSSVADQVDDGRTGIIVDINPKSIADGIIRLYEDSKLRESFVENLSKSEWGTEKEIEKIYELVM